MIRQLVWASVRQRPGKTLLLLLGYALGVGVTLSLLSIGDALVAQARDRGLVGGGDLVVLPAGIDMETLKTGGVSSMFFTIEQAPFLYREVLTSPRHAGRVAAAAPWINDELVYLEFDDELVAASAGGVIPSLAGSLDVEIDLVEGRWDDVNADRRWARPRASELYRSVDAFHVPTGEAVGDSTWAEWHYFNVVIPDQGWLYLTYMIAGAVPDGRWGGRMLATLVDLEAGERTFEIDVDSEAVSFQPGEPDVSIGASSVAIDDSGRYLLTATIPAVDGPDSLTVELTVRAESRRYVPPLELGGGGFSSGYTVPVLDGRTTGRVCVAVECTELRGARAYHDHNWGTWSDVTWDWGQATVGEYSVLYGGVRKGAGRAGSQFLFLADSNGFAGVYSLEEIRTDWTDDGASARPASISLRAISGRDSLVLEVEPHHTRETEVPVEDRGEARRFFQMRGTATLTGRLSGVDVESTGDGFFETWTRIPPD